MVGCQSQTFCLKQIKTFKSDTLTESFKVLALLWHSGAVSEGSYKNIF